MKKTKRKSSKTKPKRRVYRKITPERKPFIYERFAAGVSCIVIAEEFGEEYETVDHSTINHFLRDHPDDYEAWRTRNFKDDVRLADRKARLVSLQRVADKVRVKLEKILSEKSEEILSPAKLNLTPIGLLLREYREYIDQIRDESGDKPLTGKDQGGQGTTIVQVINTIPDYLSDGDSPDTAKENSTAGSGFRMDRL